MPVKEDRCSQSNFKQVRKLKFRKINAGSKLNDEVAHLDKNFILLTLNLSDFSFTLWFCSHWLKDVVFKVQSHTVDHLQLELKQNKTKH